MALVRDALEIVLEGGKSVLLNVTVVDGKRFYKLTPSDRKFETILVSGCRDRTPSKDRAYRSQASITVTKALKALHDSHVFTLIDPSGRRRGPDGCHSHQQYNPKELSTFMQHEGSVLTINAPQYGDAEGIPIRALIAKPRTTLSIELTTETVQYLIAAVSHLSEQAALDDREVDEGGGACDEGVDDADLTTPQKKARSYITDIKQNGQVVGVRVRIVRGMSAKNKIIKCCTHTREAARNTARDHVIQVLGEDTAAAGGNDNGDECEGDDQEDDA